MTWHTSLGDRVLSGAEADLFREALTTCVDWIEGDVDQDEAFHEFGIPVFDSVTTRGKLALLADVGYALLMETEQCPGLTAITDSTVGAIFVALDESLEHEIDNEFDLEDRTFWRRSILAAIAESDFDLETPDADSCDWDEWEFLIDVLRDRILRDRDFVLEPIFGDADPLTGEDVKLNMGIDEEYFQAVAPDPSDQELELIRRRLRLLRS